MFIMTKKSTQRSLHARQTRCLAVATDTVIMWRPKNGVVRNQNE